VTVADIVRLYAKDKKDWDGMRRAIEVEALPESWREYFRERLEKE
jgi:MOSC domain-containing protein YiiM